MRLQSSLHWLINISNYKTVWEKKTGKCFRFKLNFITLTLSDVQQHSDQFIKSKLFDPFLKYLRRCHSVRSYIWKAETQENGNIHFHITTNQFIHWKRIRNKWNDLQTRYGYLTNYIASHGNFDANSTDVHAVKKTSGIISYMLKYFLKADIFKKTCSTSCTISAHYYYKELYQLHPNTDGSFSEKKRGIHGKIWSSSTNLANVAITIDQTTPNYQNCINHLINQPNVKEIKGPYADVYYFYQINPEKLIDPLKTLYKEKLKTLCINESKQTQFNVESFYE